ncbi:hypothetical protein CCACVL1_17342 [Corchorus capsularis]|uniref:Uncharacterized protein n=1 Tax=Corchorus capsularis TaxID=210143 RepID=A0A1R3HSR3_COCAP|nr:hypothetical protein CCACVL1_17342 [Corchorus capsularis]
MLIKILDLRFREKQSKANQIRRVTAQHSPVPSMQQRVR